MCCASPTGVMKTTNASSKYAPTLKSRLFKLNSGRRLRAACHHHRVEASAPPPDNRQPRRASLPALNAARALPPAPGSVGAVAKLLLRPDGMNEKSIKRQHLRPTARPA